MCEHLIERDGFLCGAKRRGRRGNTKNSAFGQFDSAEFSEYEPCARALRAGAEKCRGEECRGNCASEETKRTTSASSIPFRSCSTSSRGTSEPVSERSLLMRLR